MLFQIIVRNGTSNHYANFDNLRCAVTIFDALTKTFQHVEMWHGAKLVNEYKNV